MEVHLQTFLKPNGVFSELCNFFRKKMSIFQVGPFGFLIFFCKGIGKAQRFPLRFSVL